MSKIAIIMGSKSDLEVMNEAANMLKEFGIEHEMKVLSAHRAPKDVAEYSENAAANGFKVIIAGAGAAAALPGVIAAHTTLPVIGVPIDSTSLKGIDALLSIVQMPSGIPVACMAIGKTGAKNAGIFAIEILAAGDKALEKKLQDYKKELADKVKSTKF
ncbi:MAG: 5-(carboxyamino)imidazole ribonucleotide mutase [Candidatus Omnitrophica bacterium CG12_big_fil_rev_8_21_14_0_65_43_15]|uniref:N5-carboxyaminoimidazole ribonucleotide mutase n=1 Tax=Candidatus Taenaricola geysiri TaxID=1974752 RepID=A0A2J0LH90_9BACT|nr:MAG: 5-(carboxyamino)imidazole ribonucleotide mutase [Candidatus Omnitrophica bacterium CG03_land_8_20_14_0_80_43_22]PIW66559.1 MAG: 5-(carboxyamino)imidazole ribonucleotide mutase [Candidatus Omnitrophica bacterium CG12_big_fil_rev_8_21_14_0_65_43_15]PIY84222.1 MAG: 5-(carboxyamino)imidazole ribonucleotide mutase [Candidatus Omnitrophica bacterium CG_4_10_14_0_8_um_filter_43_18]PJC45737.1 MAG: 5-(carboxyamino)imidazole ribonucleotide mutase [Candidatus Omnitrophica bacterium CG_4_9_14_0_2_um